MSNNKQSSVEWLIAEIQRRVYIIQSELQGITRELMINNLAVDLEQVKEMHKEEMVDFALHCQFNGSTIPGPYFTMDFSRKYNKIYLSSEQDFNETLKANHPPLPDPKLIDSMAMRYRHDFGLLSDSEKDSIRITMIQLWEETAGLGFYKP